MFDSNSFSCVESYLYSPLLRNPYDGIGISGDTLSEHLVALSGVSRIVEWFLTVLKVVVFVGQEFSLIFKQSKHGTVLWVHWIEFRTVREYKLSRFEDLGNRFQINIKQRKESFVMWLCGWKLAPRWDESQPMIALTERWITHIAWFHYPV